MAAAGDIGLAVTGSNNVVYQVQGTRRVATSGYLHQVERLAAPDFHGREAELRAMAVFCGGNDPATGHAGASAYWRWLAPAWAGKTALMARFVLDPPPGVDVVSFFVTSRLARQNDRAAFCEVLQRQLYELLHEEEPAVTEHTRDEHLRAALVRAAAESAARGRRLVLVVDGLDEDCGVVSGPDSHSIAALLPRTPPHGMRVLVAGRSHPPTPEDVPAGHPLRQHGIDRQLEPSTFAQAVRREAEDSLLRLLDSTGLGRDLVGLVAAAGGGLSAADLAELAGARLRRVERELGSAAGRMFRTRPAHWSSSEYGPRPGDVYLMAHEELQDSAMELLTEAELAECRSRLHAWADRYREREWPAGTPEYLLRGYGQLLRGQNDVSRLVALAGDPRRHERLWQRSGADLEALREITAAFEALVAHGGTEGQDVRAAAVLAVRRDVLRAYSGRFSDELIMLWAQLGHVARAVSLARARQDHTGGMRALLGVVQMLVNRGELPQAVEVAMDAAEATAGEPAGGHVRHQEAGCVAAMLAMAGRVERAIEVARTLADPFDQALALTDVACAAAHVGDYESARDIARMVGPSRADAALGSVAAVMAVQGRQLEASDLARSIQNGAQRGTALAQVAVAMGQAGQCNGAISLANEVLASDEMDHCRTTAALALAYARQPGQAGDVCRSITEPDARMGALALAAAALAESGQRSQAVAFALEASELRDTVTADNLRADALETAAKALAYVGEYQQATDLLQGIRHPEQKDEATAGMVAAIASAGDLDRAADAARTVTDPRCRGMALAQVASATARAGDLVRAEAMAHEASALTRSGSGSAPRDLQSLCAALAGEGRHELAMEVANTIEEPHIHSLALVEATRATAARGAWRSAAGIARTIGDPRERQRALGCVAVGAAEAGELDLVPEVVQEMGEFHHRGHTNGLPSEFRTAAVTAWAKALAELGQDDEALGLARTTAGIRAQANVLAAVAHGMVRSGAYERAVVLAQTIAASPRPARPLAVVATALARHGQEAHAREVVRATHSVEEQAEALSLVAKALVKVGDRLGAAAWAGAAHRVADALAVPDWRDRRLAREAEHLADIGQRDLAGAVSCHITDLSFRPPNLEDAEAAALAAEAALHVDLMASSHSHEQALSSTAATLAWSGEHARARNLVVSLTDPYTEAEARAATAAAMAAWELYVEGTELACGIPDPLQRDRALADVVQSAADASSYRSAFGTAAAISQSDLREWALGSIFDAALRASDHSAAVEAARALPRSEDRARALCAAAAAAQQRGDHKLVSPLVDEVASMARSDRAAGVVTAAAEGWEAARGAGRSRSRL